MPASSYPIPWLIGPRPTATRQMSAETLLAPEASDSYATSACRPVSLTPVTLTPGNALMPRFLKARAASFEISSSSSGAIRGSASSTVTSAPKVR